MADPPAVPRARCLCLDIETARHDRLVLREIGVFRPDFDARLRLSGKAPDLARRLDALQHSGAAEAEVISHKLMLRAGLIRKLAAGIYTWLPMGLRVLRKVERIVRLLNR